MPDRPPSPCTRTGCPNLVHGGGRCPQCRLDERRNSDDVRGSANARGYGRAHRERFRRGVLRRDPYCRCTDAGHDHDDGPCLRASTVADHWPIDRRQLVRIGLDPNDPRHGRGLCQACDAKQTARRQPGGWNRRHRRGEHDDHEAPMG